MFTLKELKELPIYNKAHPNGFYQFSTGEMSIKSQLCIARGQGKDECKIHYLEINDNGIKCHIKEVTELQEMDVSDWVPSSTFCGFN